MRECTFKFDFYPFAGEEKQFMASVADLTGRYTDNFLHGSVDFDFHRTEEGKITGYLIIKYTREYPPEAQHECPVSGNIITLRQYIESLLKLQVRMLPLNDGETLNSCLRGMRHSEYLQRVGVNRLLDDFGSFRASINLVPTFLDEHLLRYPTSPGSDLQTETVRLALRVSKQCDMVNLTEDVVSAVMNVLQSGSTEGVAYGVDTIGCLSSRNEASSILVGSVTGVFQTLFGLLSRVEMNIANKTWKAFHDLCKVQPNRLIAMAAVENLQVEPIAVQQIASHFDVRLCGAALSLIVISSARGTELVERHATYYLIECIRRVEERSIWHLSVVALQKVCQPLAVKALMHSIVAANGRTRNFARSFLDRPYDWVSGLPNV